MFLHFKWELVVRSILWLYQCPKAKSTELRWTVDHATACAKEFMVLGCLKMVWKFHMNTLKQIRQATNTENVSKSEWETMRFEGAKKAEPHHTLHSNYIAAFFTSITNILSDGFRLVCFLRWQNFAKNSPPRSQHAVPQNLLDSVETKRRRRSHLCQRWGDQDLCLHLLHLWCVTFGILDQTKAWSYVNESAPSKSMISRTCLEFLAHFQWSQHMISQYWRTWTHRWCSHSFF